MNNNTITIDDALQCFGVYKPIPKRLGAEVIEIVEQKREEKRAEIIKNLEEARLKKIYGNKVKLVYNNVDSKKEKTRERLKQKLIIKEMRNVGD
tara:strand:+ start:3359 stop:3640 length:282 start_codon:yes stop_codon:yes gene_type:complete